MITKLPSKQTFIRHRKRCINALSIAAACLIAHSSALGQGFNHYYVEAVGNSTMAPKGNSLISDQCENVVAVATMVDNAGNTDIQLTVTDYDGFIVSSYAFGETNLNESANGLCASMETEGAYLICGQSGNQHMLVMKVDADGTVFWSQEIRFNTNVSEAINILPVFEKSKRSYIIAGNSGIDVAAVRIKEDGTVIWSNEYPNSAAYLGNEVTDAIVHPNDDERRTILTGIHSDNLGAQDNAFVMSINTVDGSLYSGTTHFSTPGNFKLLKPQIAAIPKTDPHSPLYDILLTYSSGVNTSPGALPVLVHATQIGLTNPTTTTLINWQYTYRLVNPHEVDIQDIMRLDNGTFQLVGTEHPDDPFYFPFTLNLSATGNIIEARSFEIEEDGRGVSVAQICNSEEIVLSTWHLSPISVRHSQLIKGEFSEGVCSEVVEMTSIIPIVNVNPYEPYEVDAGMRVPYNMEALQLDHYVFDCDDEVLESNRIGVDLNQGVEQLQSNPTPNWFYPNPASNQLRLTLSAQEQDVRIYDNVGKLVYADSPNGNTTIDISSWSAGLYIIELENRLGESSREKLFIAE